MKEEVVRMAYIAAWSARRGSGPQPAAWKADALPIELLAHVRPGVGREVHHTTNCVLLRSIYLRFRASRFSCAGAAM